MVEGGGGVQDKIGCDGKLNCWHLNLKWWFYGSQPRAMACFYAKAFVFELVYVRNSWIFGLRGIRALKSSDLVHKAVYLVFGIN